MKRWTWVMALAVVAVLAGCGGQNQNQQAAAEQASAAGSEPVAQQNLPATQTEPEALPEEEAPAPVRTPAPKPRQQAAARPQPQQQVAQAAPPEPPKPTMASVPAGSVLTLSTDNTLDSKTAQVDDTFTATVVDDVRVGERILIPAGSTVRGRVTEAVAAKRGAGNAKLSIAFDTLELESGYRTQIIGTFQQVTESKKKRNAAVIGGSAAGGALLGRILGKDTKGAVIGSIIGGGIGTAVVMGKEGEQVTIPAGTPFEIHLDEAVKVPSKASGA
jgi:hypothetical protein